MRHSSIANSNLSNSPSSFYGSTGTQVQTQANKKLKIQTARNEIQKKSSKNKIGKYYDRSSLLSPRSWIKKTNVKEKEKGLEFLASRLSLVNKVPFIDN